MTISEENSRNQPTETYNPKESLSMADMILTEEEQMLQNLVRDFADRELMLRAKEVDEKEEFSWENWKGMADLGLTGISIDPKYGGSGGGYLGICR